MVRMMAETSFSDQHSRPTLEQFLTAARVTGHNTIPKNGQIEFPTLTDGVRVNDNSLVSQVVEEDAAHGTSGGTIHDSGAFS